MFVYSNVSGVMYFYRMSKYVNVDVNTGCSRAEIQLPGFGLDDLDRACM